MCGDCCIRKLNQIQRVAPQCNRCRNDALIVGRSQAQLIGRWGQFGGHVSFYLTASGGGAVMAGGAPQASQVCRRSTGPFSEQALNSLWLQDLPPRADSIAGSLLVGHLSPCLHLGCKPCAFDYIQSAVYMHRNQVSTAPGCLRKHLQVMHALKQGVDGTWVFEEASFNPSTFGLQSVLPASQGSGEAAPTAGFTGAGATAFPAESAGKQLPGEHLSDFQNTVRGAITVCPEGSAAVF